MQECEHCSFKKELKRIDKREKHTGNVVTIATIRNGKQLHGRERKKGAYRKIICVYVHPPHIRIPPKYRPFNPEKSLHMYFAFAVNAHNRWCECEIDKASNPEIVELISYE